MKLRARAKYFGRGKGREEEEPIPAKSQAGTKSVYLEDCVQIYKSTISHVHKAKTLSVITIQHY